MASICPKCHTELEEDAVCCAAMRHTWKCKSCGKRSTGFVVPYGRCYLCGGQNEVVEAFEGAGRPEVKVVEEAMQFEVDVYHFYRLGQKRATDPGQKELFEQLFAMEREHLDEIESKYHVHLDPHVLEVPPDAERLLAGWLFQDVDVEAPAGRVKPLYEMALTMERRTRDHFLRRSQELPPGLERELCREFAAEEEDHIAMLETELANFEAAQR